MMARLNAHPASLVLIEINRPNFPAVLACLADAVPRYASARFAALLDGQLDPPRAAHFPPPRNDRQLALDALTEAGACEFALSPRHLQAILRLGKRQAALAAMQGQPSDKLSINAWAWALLPWQDG